MKVKVKNISESPVMITGYPAIDAGATLTVTAEEAKALTANPNIQEVVKKESSFKGVNQKENSAKL